MSAERPERGARQKRADRLDRHEHGARQDRAASRTLAVRLDNDGDVLLTGPALRALAAVDPSGTVDLLASPQGAAAAALLPRVADVLTFAAPWSGFEPPAVDAVAVAGLVDRLRARGYARAVVFTSFHQSPLPMALLARLAGITWVGATSVDYPGSLLDLRHRRGVAADGGDLHEAAAALELAIAAGGRLPAGDDGRLAVRPPEPGTPTATAPATAAVTGSGRPYVVLHPGASVPSRAMDEARAGRTVRALAEDGWVVAVTGGPGETALTARVTGTARGAVDLGGRTDLAGLASLLAGAACAVVGNTGPAHLAAAVGTPVVSLFSPVVPARRWAPTGVPSVVLGDQTAACRDTRARQCPVPGHPCLAGVDENDVVDAVRRLTTPGRSTRYRASGIGTSGHGTPVGGVARR